MIDFSFDLDIARSLGCFSMVTDLTRLTEWQPLLVEVEHLQEGPLRQGSRLREVREVRGKRLEQFVEVAALKPAGGSGSGSWRARCPSTVTSPSRPQATEEPDCTCMLEVAPGARCGCSSRC